MKRHSKGKTATLQGRLDLHADGYGFVLFDQKNIPDLFVPPHQIHGAMDGDRVEASFNAQQKGRKREGKILRVLERSKSQLVGRFEAERDGFFVLCGDRRNIWKVKIPVGRTLNALSGQNVVVRITRYPDGPGMLEGEVIRLLGERNDPFTEIDVIIAEHHLPVEFPAEALAEGKAFGDRIPSAEELGRRDLRSYPIVTIDGETAKDFDDGVFVEKTSEGYRLYVAIADVSYYVREGSALEKEATRRGASVYFPSRCIPMLPEELSNGLCSLLPNEDRLAFVAEMDFDAKGKKIHSQFYRALIRNQARLTYTIVKGLLVDRSEALRAEYPSLVPHLETAYGLFKLLRERRMFRGSIDFDLPEPQIILDMEEGIATSILKSSRNEAHMLIEEFMIAANEAVAEFVAKTPFPMIYRVHEPPAAEKLEEFRAMVHNLGYSLPPAEHIQPKDLAGLVRKVKGKPHERLVNTLLLRSLKQAVYGTENVGHFGLASQKYTHFTSPIRRFPDLLVHRILALALDSLKGGRKLDKGGEERLKRLSAMALHCSQRERNAMEAEWAVRDLHVALFMKDKIGEVYDGIISSVTRFGFFVELDPYFVEGLVSLNTLNDDSYEFLEKRHELRGRRLKKAFKIGDKVRVKVARVDLERRQLDFLLEPPQTSEKPSALPPPDRKLPHTGRKAGSHRRKRRG